LDYNSLISKERLLLKTKGEFIMSNSENNNGDTNAPERKKISLKEAMQQKLESKKQEQASGKRSTNGGRTNTNMKSQQTSKKANTQRRKLGE
jgi:hypothetical protein